MTMSGAQVQVGAVQAAWDQASILRSLDQPSAWPALSERVATAAALYGAGELSRGTLWLIGSALHLVGGGRLGGEGFAEQFTRTLMDKIGQWGDVVEPSDLPMVRRVVTAVFDGRDPVAWRDSAGPVPDSEPRAMTCALALIADFVDHVDGPGAAERGLLSALSRAID
ncbi:hypothetical protein ACIG54_07325 [Streptomyces achromogenes]|uniref:hypothetical protein n=1 Tax=Streptomyces achromogenes TaxID=67255 RepID=UPI0037D51BF0